jgi:hypothetical protein
MAGLGHEPTTTGFPHLGGPVAGDGLVLADHLRGGGGELQLAPLDFLEPAAKVADEPTKWTTGDPALVVLFCW